MERLILNTVNGEIKFEYCEWRDSFWILWMERCILNTVNWEIKFEKKEKIDLGLDKILLPGSLLP